MFWLPPLLKSQAEQLVGEQLGREVHIGQVEFRPWTLELSVADIVMLERSGGGEQFRLGLVYLDVAWASVVRMAPVVDALWLSAPQGRLVRLGEGRYDIDDILQRLASRPAETAGKPLAFALYNLRVADGRFEFVDQPKGVTHVVRALNVGVPFLSSLPSYREVETRPHLSFTLNGSQFDTTAESLPFAETRETEARFRIEGLDVKPYLAYLPVDLPVRLHSGVLDADLQLRFQQMPSDAKVVLQGRVRAIGLAAVDAAQQDVLGIDAVVLDIADLQPLQRSLALSSLEIDTPRISLRRDAAGTMAWLPARSPAPIPASTSATTQGGGWSVVLDQLTVRDGGVRWVDHAAAPGAAPAELSLDRLQLRVGGVRWPFSVPARLEGEAALAATQGRAADLSFSGTASDTAAQVQLRVGGADLAMAAPYLTGLLRPALQGSLSAQAAVSWQAPDALVVTAEQLVLDRLALVDRARALPALATLRRLELRNARVDLTHRSAEIGSVRLQQPQLTVQRQRDGRWMFEDWLLAGPSAPPAGAGAPASPAWRYAIDSLELNAGTVEYADQAVARPAALSVSGIELRLRGVQSDLAQPLDARLAAHVAAGSARVSGAGTPGRLRFEGRVTPLPLAVQGQVDGAQLPLAALEPYFGDGLNLQVERANASFAGTLRVQDRAAGLALHVAGDLGVQDLRARQRADSGEASGRELLSWNALRLRGLALDLVPGTATRLEVEETLLTDFYARVIVNEGGRINLQDLVKRVDAPVAAASSAPVAEASARVRFGPIRLQNGRVLFSDRFIKPNYTANLTELHGGLSAFASAAAGGTVAGGAPALAELELRGRAEGTASLEITGKLNPLADPLALDIRGKVRDLELPPLSPYSVKYAGHGIERGKLSVDVHYQVQPDGRLTATNSLVLNQLTFGEPVAGAPASLPVRLATALLSDRHGVIDLNLPIQGSLNDPEFSLGPVIFKAIVNLVVKAVTAPFSLLASAFGGGGEELSTVAFAHGSAVLGDAARARLDKVATALTDRPQLKLTVAGSASRAVEEEGLRRERLRRMLQAEKRRQAAAVGQGDAAAERARTPVSEDEYPALLKALYQRAEMAKPRNALGLVKDIAPAEMEALLLADLQVSDDALRQLALQRAVAVRDHLAAQSVPLERLFLGAARLVPGTEGWSPSAELKLATP